MGGEVPSTLIVDDEPAVVDTHAGALPDDHGVRRAYDGREALEAYDETVDLVLLDRRLPDRSGDDVLTEIRRRRGTCRVVLVTALEPDFEVLELDIDDYLRKPVSPAELRGVVERYAARGAPTETIRRYFALLTRKASYEATLSEAELATKDGYRAVVEEIDVMEARLDGIIDDLTLEDYAATYRALVEEE